MEKYTTYKDSELRSNLDFMDSALSKLDVWVKMMEEQANGERTNLDMSVCEQLRPQVEKLKDGIKRFNIKL